MSYSRFKLNLGLGVLLFFSIAGPFKGTILLHGTAYSLSPPTFIFLAAPALQATSYPPPPTQTTPGYPEPPTATTGSGYPGPQTATPGLVSSSTPSPNQTGTTVTPALATGTPSQTPTAGINTYLTENAEMGQSRATPVPTETPSPSPTLTSTPIPTQPTAAIPPDQGFDMNWGVFLIAFLGMIVVGGAAWLTFLRRAIFRKV